MNFLFTLFAEISLTPANNKYKKNDVYQDAAF
jgi:hypothetical protein